MDIRCLYLYLRTGKSVTKERLLPTLSAITSFSILQLARRPRSSSSSDQQISSHVFLCAARDLRGTASGNGRHARLIGPSRRELTSIHGGDQVDASLPVARTPSFTLPATAIVQSAPFGLSVLSHKVSVLSDVDHTGLWK